MSNFFSIEQIKQFILKNVDSTYEGLDSQQIATNLIARLSSLSSESDDKRTLYTGRDITDLRNYLIKLVQDTTDKWTDFNESDVGMVILELISGIGDMLGFYLDKNTKECYITDVKQRKNGAAILKLIGYNLSLTKSFVTTGRFVLPDELVDSNITIPAYTQVSAILPDKSRIYYATLDTIEIPEGDTSIETPLTQGEVNTLVLKVSELRKNSKINILAEDIAEGTISLDIGGEEWELVPDVLLDDQPGRKYSLFEDKNCKPYIIMHSSYENYLPADDSAVVTFKFLTSLGSKGYIREGLISYIDTPIYLGNEDISTSIEVTNIEASSGGSDRETLDHARVNAPNQLAMLGKAIILQDYQDMASRLPGIAKCKAIDWSIDHGRYVAVPYQVDLYVVPVGSYELSSQQAKEITDYFADRRKQASIQLNVRKPNYVDINISLIVHTNASSKNNQLLENMIIALLKTTFIAENLEFGFNIRSSNIISLIENSDRRINYIELLSPTDNIPLDLTQFPRLGKIDITIIND